MHVFMKLLANFFVGHNKVYFAFKIAFYDVYDADVLRDNTFT